MRDFDKLDAQLSVMDLSETVRDKVRLWLKLDLDGNLRKELESLIVLKDSEAINDRFETMMAFGTGGMRGPMGVGTNRINHVMIARATQGLAEYVLEMHDGSNPPSAVVCYDSRINSERYSKQTASTFAAHGIHTYLFKELRPTPELSFAVRHLGATTGVMITASHNPKEDNGFKAYWSDGGQVVPPHDDAIIGRVEATQPDTIKTMDFDQAVEKGLIEWVDGEIDEVFLDAVLEQRINPEVVARAGKDLKIVFTGLHGTGGTMVPQALERWGFPDVILPPSQAEPDGEFPTVKSANPEEGAAFAESIKVAGEIGAHLVLATDPDCDRVGIAVRDSEGEYKLMSGNETGALLTYYVINERKVKGKMPVNPAVVKTIVTTDLVSMICRQFGVTLDNTLTGFKWIGAKIDEYEKQGTPDNPGMNYVFGFEESYGYLAGTHARDKDAVVASCLIAEMAGWAMAQKKTLLDLLDDVMSIFGLFAESQISIYRRGYDGQEEIAQLMDSLRKDPPLKFLDEEVRTVIDVLHDKINERYSGEYIGPANLPKSNVLVFQTMCGAQVVARPSGTEPKVKFYFSNSDLKQLPIADREEFKQRKAALAERHEQLRREFIELVESRW